MSADLDARDPSTSRYGARRVHRDAFAVAVGSAINAVLGVAFWAYAARFVTPDELGVMTAILSVITAVGSVIAAGVGDAYSAVLPAVGRDRPTVFRRGLRLASLLSVVAGVVSAVLVVATLSEVRADYAVAALIVVGILAWSAYGLQGATLIAIGRANWVPPSNIAHGVAKIVLLPALVATIAWQSVPLAVVIASLCMVVVLRPAIRRIVDTGDGLPTSGTIEEGRAVVEFHRVVTRTTALSGLNLGVLALTPFLVTLFAGPDEGARFALVFSIVSTLDFIGASMAVSLAVHASGAPGSARAMATKLLSRAGVVTVLGSIGAAAVVPVALHVLNPAYDMASTLAVVVVLCAGSIIRLPYLVWAALRQSQRRLRAPLVLSGATAILLFALMPVFCAAMGAVGAALVILVHQAVLTAGAAIVFARRHLGEDAHGRGVLSRFRSQKEGM
ncbi:lipopolysaccharide biosynthesis protein [Gordonia sp. NPDC057258]|uniref:lipopolysaccharide biosynthesis protein n=1 Tax=unclassified Gordonia (in: high G+C Gram-positive bacteria) TaxID=2657482 RepID=UPI00362BC511